MAKLEFSKKIIIVNICLAFTVAIGSIILMFHSSNLDALNILIPSIFAQLATSTGFYYNKAKEENKMKMSKKIEKKPEANSKK